MPNQDYYQGYYDYFSPKGGGGTQGLYDAWGLIDKYQQDPSQLQGQQLKDAQWWMGQNAGQNYANPWNFASTHYNLYPTGPHANKYNAYLRARTTGMGNGDSGGGGSPSFNPNFKGNMPAGYQNLLKQWDSLRGKTNLPGAIGEGYGRDLAMESTSSISSSTWSRGF